MGNRSSRGSLDYYNVPPVPVQPMQQVNQMPRYLSSHRQQSHTQVPQPAYYPGSYHSDTPNSYQRSRKRRPWYSFGRRRDRYRAQDLWYQPFVSPEGPVVPPPFIYNPGATWGAPVAFVQNPAQNDAQYDPIQFPGYTPAPPVIPEDMVSPMMRHMRREQPHARQHAHYTHQSQPVREPQMMMPQPQLAPPPVGTSPDATFSLPFKPFPPLPLTRGQRPPTPPQNIMALSPYKSSFRHLVHPSPTTRARAMEILNNPEQTDIQNAHQQWQRQDEEREKALQEKREQRNRMLNGAVIITAPTAQTIPGDPRFVEKKNKPRKSLFDSLSSAFRKRDDENAQPNMTTAGMHYPMPFVGTAVMPSRGPSPAPSAHTLAPTPNVVAMPTPVVIPSPFLPFQTRATGSTTPPFPPPNPNFVEVTTEMYADLLPMSSHSVVFPPDTDPSQVERWPTAAHLYLASKFFDVKPKRVKKIKKTENLEEVLRLVQQEWDDGIIREGWESIKTNMLEDIMYLKFCQHPTLRRLLVETGNLPIVCNVQHYVLRDHRFGMMLMRVRDRLLRDGENNF